MPGAMDERVVSMEFDNRQFEKNVRHSMKTIDDLKESLDFDKSSESLNELDKSFRKFNENNNFRNLDESAKGLRGTMSLLGSSATSLVGKFAEMTKIVALFDMAEAAVQRLKRSISQFTIAPISEGFSKYETKISSIKTISNATGMAADSVNDQLERLNWFTDETSASFGEMVNNIGKFTSVGRQLNESITAMQGIANWGYQSGAGVSEINRAMYNLSQALGTGSVKLIDWKSIENAGMATKEFKEQAIAAAEAAGTLKRKGDKLFTKKGNKEVNFSNFNETLQQGWFTSDVLMSTLEVYGGYADKVRSYIEKHPQYSIAAQAMEAMDSERLDNRLDIFGKTMDLWVEKTGKTADSINAEIERIKGIEDLDDREKEIRTFVKSLGLSADEMARINKITNVKEREKEIKKWADTINVDVKQATKILEEYAATEETLGEKAFKSAQQSKSFRDSIEATKDAVSTQWMNSFQTIFGGLEESVELWSDVTELLWELFASGGDARNNMLTHWAEEFSGRDDLWGPDGILHSIIDTILELKELLGTSFKNVFFPDLERVAGIWNTEEGLGISNGLYTVDQIRDRRTGSYMGRQLKNITQSIKEFFQSIRAFFTKNKTQIQTIFTTIARVVKLITDTVGKVFKMIGNVINRSGIFQDVLNIVTRIAEVISDIIQKIEKSKVIDTVLTGIGDTLVWFYDLIKGWITQIYEFFDEVGLFDLILSFFGGIGDSMASGASGVFGWLSSIKEWLSSINMKTVLYAIKDAIEKFVSWLESSGILPAVRSWFNSVIDFFSNIDFRDIISKVGGAFVTAFNWIKNRFTDFVNWIAGSGVWSTIKSWFNSIIEFFRSISVSDILSTVGGVFSAGWNAMISAFVWIKDRLGDFVNWLESSGVLPTIRSWFNAVIDFFRGISFGDIFSSIGGAFSKGWNAVVTAFTWVKDRFTDFVNWLEDSGVLQTIRSWFNAVIDFFRSINFGGIFSKVGNAFGTGWNAIVTAFTWVKDRLSDFVNWLESSGIMPTIRSWFSAIGDFFSGISFGGIFSTVGGALSKGWNAVVNAFTWVKDRFTDFINWLKDSGILSTIRSWFSAIGGFFRSIDFGKIFEVLKNVALTIWNSLVTAFTWVRDKWNALIGWLDNIGVLPKIKSIAKKIGDFFGNIGLLWKIFVQNNGQYDASELSEDQLSIVQGIENFINGIREKFEWIKNKFIEIKDTVVGWLEDTGILPTLRDWWSGITDWFGSLEIPENPLEEIGDFFVGLYEQVASLFGGGGSDEAAGTSSIGDTFSSLVPGGESNKPMNIFQQMFANIKEAFTNEDGSFNLIKGLSTSIAKVFEFAIELIKKIDFRKIFDFIADVLVEGVNAINAALGKIQTDNIEKLLQKALFYYFMFKFIGMLANGVKLGANLAKGKKKKAFDIVEFVKVVGEALLQIGIAVLLVVASIWILGTMDSATLWRSVAVIGIFFAAIIAVIMVCAYYTTKVKDGKNVGQNIPKMLAALGQAFLQISIALLIIVAAITVMTFVFKTQDPKHVWGAIVLIAGILVVMIGVIYILAKITKKVGAVQIKTGIEAFSGIAVLLGTMTVCIMLLTLIPFGEAVVRALLLMAVLVVIALAIRMIGKLSISKHLFKTVAAFAAIIGIVAMAMVLLQLCPWYQMIAVAGSFALVILAVAGAIYWIKDVKIDEGTMKIVGWLIGLIASLTVAFLLLQNTDWLTTLLTAVSMGLVIIAIAGAMKMMNEVKIEKNVLGAIGIFGGIVDSLTAIMIAHKDTDWKVALAVGVGMAAVMVAIGGAILMLSNIKETSIMLKPGKVAKLAASIGIIVAAIIAVLGLTINIVTDSVTKIMYAIVQVVSMMASISNSAQFVDEDAIKDALGVLDDCLDMIDDIAATNVSNALTAADAIWKVLNKLKLASTSASYVDVDKLERIFGKEGQDGLLKSIETALSGITNVGGSAVTLGSNLETFSNSLQAAGVAGVEMMKDLGKDYGNKSYMDGIDAIKTTVDKIKEITDITSGILEASRTASRVGTNIQTLGEKLQLAGQSGTSLGTGSEYAQGITNIKERMSDIQAIITAATALTSNENGETGKVDLTKLSEGIANIGAALQLYDQAMTTYKEEAAKISGDNLDADGVAPVSVQNIQQALTSVMTVLQDLNPPDSDNISGVEQWANLTPDGNAGTKFALGLTNVANAMSVFSKAAEDYNSEKGELAIKALGMLKDIFTTIQNPASYTGKMQLTSKWEPGNTDDPSTFAGTIVGMANALGIFSNSAEKYNYIKGQRAIGALGMLAGIYAKVSEPSKYQTMVDDMGKLNVAPGDTSQKGTFANTIIGLGNAMKSFSNSVANIKSTAVNDATTALDTFATLHEKLSGQTTLMNYLSGKTKDETWDMLLEIATSKTPEDTLGSLGAGIGLIGDGLQTFAQQATTYTDAQGNIKDINYDKLKEAVGIINTLADIHTALIAAQLDKAWWQSLLGEGNGLTDLGRAMSGLGSQLNTMVKEYRGGGDTGGDFNGQAVEMTIEEWNTISAILESLTKVITETALVRNGKLIDSTELLRKFGVGMVEFGTQLGNLTVIMNQQYERRDAYGQIISDYADDDSWLTWGQLNLDYWSNVTTFLDYFKGIAVELANAGLDKSTIYDIGTFGEDIMDLFKALYPLTEGEDVPANKSSIADYMNALIDSGVSTNSITEFCNGIKSLAEAASLIHSSSVNADDILNLNKIINSVFGIGENGINTEGLDATLLVVASRLLTGFSTALEQGLNGQGSSEIKSVDSIFDAILQAVDFRGKGEKAGKDFVEGFEAATGFGLSMTGQLATGYTPVTSIDANGNVSGMKSFGSEMSLFMVTMNSSISTARDTISEIKSQFDNPINVKDDHTDIVTAIGRSNDRLETIKDDVRMLKTEVNNLKVFIYPNKLVGAISGGIDRALGGMVNIGGRP